MLGGLNEFNTAVRNRLNLIVILCNDGAYGAEHVQYRRKDLDPTLALFDWPDFAEVATALGGRGFTARTAAELDALLADLPGRSTPVLIDVRLDPDAIPALA
jgi:thiamine pyrophosphate-dependent acetolactate synthase large subunit-like protein